MVFPSQGGVLTIIPPAGTGVAVNITASGSQALPTLYLSDLSTTQGPAQTVSATTSWYAKDDVDVVVSAKINGQECANGNGGTLTAHLRNGEFLIIGPVETASEASTPAHLTPGDLGYLGWSCDPAAAAGTRTLATGGTLEVSLVKGNPGSSVSNIDYVTTTAGATLTSGQNFVQVFDAISLASLGTSADQSTNFAATAGLQSANFVTPFSVPAHGKVFVAFWSNGTTKPTFATAVPASAGMANAGSANTNSQKRAGTADTGKTTAGPATLGTITATANVIWAGLR